MNVRNRLLTSVTGILILACLVMVFAGYYSGNRSLKDAAFKQLTSVREIKSRQIEDYFQQIDDQVTTFSQDQMIVEAMKAFKSAFHQADTFALTALEEKRSS